jgi:hypothetical protein
MCNNADPSDPSVTSKLRHLDTHNRSRVLVTHFHLLNWCAQVQRTVGSNQAIIYPKSMRYHLDSQHGLLKIDAVPLWAETLSVAWIHTAEAIQASALAALPARVPEDPNPQGKFEPESESEEPRSHEGKGGDAEEEKDVEGDDGEG